MNIISKHRSITASIGLLALSACIQGPWDYYPENPAVFRGIYVTGYILSGKPVTDFCMERILRLSEEATQAFAFYDSADVRITGRFNGRDTTIALAARDDAPNCFRGDSSLLAGTGGNYALEARVSWDSSGSRVTSVITGTAKVPAHFSIDTTAAAPSLAETGQIPEDIFTLQFFNVLSPEIRATLAQEYGDSLLARLVADTVFRKEYLEENGNGIQQRVIELIGQKLYVYGKGDSVFYLNGALNTLSHYYTARRSPDVGTVLISHRFEKSAKRPETRFDSPLGLEPDSSEYYFPGEIRRLLAYPDAKGPGGWNLLDSMGVVNLWFLTGLNRLYFYGMEAAYYSFLRTATQVEGGGGESDGDPRVKPNYNLEGGYGIFVGGIPDSFDLVILTDNLTKTYPLDVVHANYCRDEGWYANKDCRSFLREHCSGNGWSTPDCREDAMVACLAADQGDTTLPVGDTAFQALCDTIVNLDDPMGRHAHRRFCVERNFTAESGVCDAPKTECLETGGINDCKQALWSYCLDNNWRPEQCAPGVASYCNDKPRLSEPLCRQADKYCAANAGSVLCE